MSTYVLSLEGVVFKCHMAYTPGGYVICEIEGVEPNCLATMVKRLNLNYVWLEEDSRLYISTEIHAMGKSAGEVIKEIATAVRLC